MRYCIESLKRLKSQNAFTLIELLIVVAIIGILAAIAVPNFQNAFVRAKVSRSIADLRSIQTAIEMYSTDHGREILDFGEFPSSSGQNSAWEVWRQLTTPVSYISSSAFIDPFIVTDNPFGSAAGEAVRAGTYQYHNIKFWRETGRGASPDLYDKTARYYVRSPGPDRWYIVLPHRLMRWMAYNPTNGLTSIGDIIISDKGLLGQSFVGNDGPVDNIG